jgi:hypothetical protein
MAPTAEGDIRHTDPEAEQAITDFFRSAAERRRAPVLLDRAGHVVCLRLP